MALNIASTFYKCQINLGIVIIIIKPLLRQCPRNESSSVAHLVQRLRKLIVQAQCKVHQQYKCSPEESV